MPRASLSSSSRLSYFDRAFTGVIVDRSVGQGLTLLRVSPGRLCRIGYEAE